MRPIVVILGSSGYLGQAATLHFRESLGGASVVTIDKFGADHNLDLEQGFELESILQGVERPGGVSHVSLINCAGFTVFSHNLDRTVEEITAVSMSQLGISILALNQLIGFCIKRGISGNGILVSSIFARNAPRFEIYEALDRESSEIYGATKAGIEQLARYYAKKYGPNGIRVNCVSPGGILDTKIHSEDFQRLYATSTALGRMTNLSEVVSAISFFASEASSGITGVSLPVDCGYGL